MSAENKSIIDININSGSIHRSFAMNILGEGETGANVFGARLFRNGEPVDLTGCVCMGYFIRADGNTVAINGSISGNVASVLLPASCYVYPGQFTLAVKIVGDTIGNIVRIVDGYVLDMIMGSIIDPGGVVSSVSDVLAKIAELESAISAVNEAKDDAIGELNTAKNSAIAAKEAIENVGLTTELISGDNYRLIINVQ